MLFRSSYGRFRIVILQCLVEVEQVASEHRNAQPRHAQFGNQLFRKLVADGQLAQLHKAVVEYRVAVRKLFGLGTPVVGLVVQKIQQAVMALFQIEAHKIKIIKMK